MPELPMILALDPGGTTGICLFNPTRENADHQVEVEHLGPEEHHKELWEFLAETLGEALRCNVPLHIVCESFEFRMTERHRDFINYIPREYIGVAKLFHQVHVSYVTVAYKEQPAGVVKPFWTDDKIKKLGLWVPGRKHAMDATRHYLYYRVFTLGDQSVLMGLK